MKLSEHFDLEEFTFSPVAIRLGIDNTPPLDAEEALDDLCYHTLEPIRQALDKPIHITSGYRNEALNKAIGGALRSQHCRGEAADFTVEGMSVDDVYQWIKANPIVFDQLINEFDGSWVHISYSHYKNRRQCLRAYKKNGVTVYAPDNSINN